MKKIFPNEVVIETKYFDAHQDWEVPIPGFIIVTSKRKIRSMADFTEEEAQEFIKLIIKIRKGMKEVLNIKDVYLIENEDTKHNFHLWIFPRHDWMEKFGRKIESVRPIMLHAQKSMVTDEIIKQVKEDIKKMHEYMEDF
jgi:diadenosine tetraphosphate (Ap4A) HIT family hydrolase